MNNFKLDKFNNFANRIIKKGFQLSQKMYSNKRILIILGCQRSGTTLVTKIFDKDLHTSVFGEFSAISSEDKLNKIRINSFENIKDLIEKEKSRFIIMKPIVESQNAKTLLEKIPNSKVLWMFRDYKDVVLSNIKKFGKKNGIMDLSPIVNKENNNWRAEKITEEIRNIVIKYYSAHMNPYDGAALFWYVRNSIYFKQNLNGNNRVMLCDYNDLVLNPKSIMDRIYKFVNLKYPGDKLIRGVHISSLGKGRMVPISEEINELCIKIMEQLVSTKNRQYEFH